MTPATSSPTHTDSILWALPIGHMDWALTPPAVQDYIRTLRERPYRIGIRKRLKKRERDWACYIAKQCHRLGIILLETGSKLVAQAGLLIDQLAQVETETIEQPIVGWRGREWFKALAVGTQKMRQRQGIEAVVFGGRQDMPIFVPIDRLGINGIDLIALTQQIVDQQSTRGFQRHQDRGGVYLMLGKLRMECREAFRTMGNWNWASVRAVSSVTHTS